MIFIKVCLQINRKIISNSFYLQDYSLSEIADTFEVSRQAVYDNIRRTGDLVEDYESKLRLYQRFEKRRELYNLMKQSLNQPEFAIYHSIRRIRVVIIIIKEGKRYGI